MGWGWGGEGGEEREGRAQGVEAGRGMHVYVCVGGEAVSEWALRWPE